MTSAPASSLPKNLHDETSPPVLDPSRKFLGAHLINKAKGSGSSRPRSHTRAPGEALSSVVLSHILSILTLQVLSVLIQTPRLPTARICLFASCTNAAKCLTSQTPLGDLKACHHMHSINIRPSIHTLPVCSRGIKRASLTEMIEFIQAMPSAVTPRVYPEVVRMFSANLFRSLPPPLCRSEEDEPALEPAWPHLQVKEDKCIRSCGCSYLMVMCVTQNVYELFLKFLEMREFDVPSAKTCLDSKLVENVCHGLHMYLANSDSLIDHIIRRCSSCLTIRTRASVTISRHCCTANMPRYCTSAHSFARLSITSTTSTSITY